MARPLQGCGVWCLGAAGGFGPLRPPAPARPVWTWLSGAAGTQEMAANPCTEPRHRGTQTRTLGAATPLAPVSTDPAAGQGYTLCTKSRNRQWDK